MGFKVLFLNFIGGEPEVGKLTPMMQQFKQIKEQYPDTILFFRVGDFYEMFFEDATVASKELEIALTSRDGNRENGVPLAGFPHHASSGYITRLLKRGYKVAICEQIEDPSKAQGLVKREVIRVITPGTSIEENLLEEDRNNYLASVNGGEDGEEYGLAVIDVSTGELLVFQYNGPQGNNELQEEIARLNPSEILFAAQTELRPGNHDLLKEIEGNRAVNYLNPFSDRESALEFLQGLNAPVLLEGLNGITSPAPFLAAATALFYIKEMQKAPFSHFQKIRFINKSETMSLDVITLRNLEIFETIRTRDKRGSLYGILNRTKTSMGSRLLRRWLQKPLLEKEKLTSRWDAVEELKNNPYLQGEVKKLLRDITDLERFCGRLNLGQIGPREMLALKRTLQLIPSLKEALLETRAGLLQKMQKDIPDCALLAEELESSLNENAPFQLKDGKVFKPGYSNEIDELQKISGDSKTWMLELERQERERTGIRTLKTGFNKVFGYYLEVTKLNQERVPANYIRKQTLANAERFITQELKEKEELIFSAEEKLARLEADLFRKLCQKTADYTPQLQLAAGYLATLDCLFSLADTASANNYVRPSFAENGRIDIKGGRHPVVEQKGENPFVPNDIFLDKDKERIQIITGPNMAGKSTYCRSAALLLIMAQAGSFVPAEEMAFTPLKRIFARVGASDDLSRGRSTFMVEMEETASILTSSAEDCLILLDEIGRGTSTYDGMSLARAILEYLHGEEEARVLFSTHYHELTMLEEKLPGIKNYTVTVRENGDEVIFLRKVAPGKADRSYGVNVARMAGLPGEVISRAQELLKEIEEGGPGRWGQQSSLQERESGQLSLLRPSASLTSPSEGEEREAQSPSRRRKPGRGAPAEGVIEEIMKLNLVNLTPLDALLKLFSYQNHLSGVKTPDKEKDW